MTRLLLIAFAGALGTLTRYGVTLWANRTFGQGLPYGTLIVNVVGCFLIAAIMHVALTTTHLPDTARLTLTVGFMGGLTTYSSFNYETTLLLREKTMTGLANLGLTLVLCFVAGIAGLFVAQRFTAG